MSHFLKAYDILEEKHKRIGENGKPKLLIEANPYVKYASEEAGYEVHTCGKTGLTATLVKPERRVILPCTDIADATGLPYFDEDILSVGAAVYAGIAHVWL